MAEEEQMDGPAGPPTREEIGTLLRSIERYNPGNVDLLIRYLKQTCEDQTYDIEAYLAILKLYQFNPGLFDIETTRTILLKALTSLPSNDFTLCLYLLPQIHHAVPQIEILIMISNELEQCRFEDFWEFLEQDSNVLNAKVRVQRSTEENDFEHQDVEIKGFTDSIRSFVAHVINHTYQVVDAELLSKMLGGLKGEELKSFAEKQNWKLDGKGKVFVASQEDIVQSKSIMETLNFQSLIPLMAASNSR
eukprot:m.332848 g.332848  ORF g.332848 m.332848 type:complete len:248 (+) comp17016_c0_seq1:93-836(+)